MRSLISLALVILVACGDDSTTAPTNDSVAGTWSLQSINGTGLPYVVFQIGADKVELVSDVVVAVASGAFTQTTVVRTRRVGKSQRNRRPTLEPGRSTGQPSRSSSTAMERLVPDRSAATP